MSSELEHLQSLLADLNEKILEQEQALANSETTTSEIADRNNMALELSRLKGKRERLEKQIQNRTGKVGSGYPTVTVEHGTEGTEVFVVAPVEYEPADQDVTRVTPDSPIGMALRGSRVGQTVKLPYGPVKVTELRKA